MNFTWTFAWLGALLSAAGIYELVNRKIPSRLRIEQAPHSKFGMERADDFGSQGTAYGVDIIFVHGLGSNPDTTWCPRSRKDKDTTQATSDSADKTCWVSDFLSEDIPAPLRRDVRIFFYNYDSYWKRDAVQTRLWNIGESLLNHVKTSIRRTEDEQTRNLVFVGHSYGGLVIKKAFVQATITQSFKGIAEHTRAVLFLGTPHRGSSFSKWGNILAQALQPLGSNPLLLQEIAYDSKSLLDLHREFVKSSGEQLRIFNFFEARRTRLIKAWFIQWEEFCVREQSATYEGANVENIELPVDHYGLNKFKSKNENYNVVLRKLLDLVTPTGSQRQRKVYSLPLKTVESYTERPELSLAVAEKLHTYHEKSSVPHALAIHGLGGSGKTQLALKYVEDHKDKYNTILWMNAEDENSMRLSFERAVSELQLIVDRAQAQGSTLFDSPSVRAVHRWLRDRKDTNDTWLVVIDNADDVSWGVKKLLPEGNQGSIIITSQDSRSRELIHGECEELRTDTMEPLEARELLLRNLHRSSDVVTDDIRKACDTVAERLGYLPLAIDLARAFISNDTDTMSAIQQFLTDYDRHQDDLLQSEHYHGLSATDKTVWTVWDTTLEKLERRYAAFRPGLLLAFLAHLSGTIVEDELFRLASLAMPNLHEDLSCNPIKLPDWLDNILAFNGDGWDSFHYRQARDVLVRYSLLQRVEGERPGVVMHGLVQWRATRYRPDLPWDDWHLAVTFASYSQGLKEEASPQVRREISIHFPKINREYLQNSEVCDTYEHGAWCEISAVYLSEKRWKEAEELAIRALEESSMALGEEHPCTLCNMNNLVGVYANQGRWKEAEELGSELIDISKRVLGEEHPHTLRSMSNLVATYAKQERWKEAEELGLEVMEMRNRVLGEWHLDTLAVMANLAVIFGNQGRLREAEELGLQVMDTRKRILGKKHPDTLNSMSNLAFTLKQQDRKDEAISLMEKCFQLQRQALGPHHPDTEYSLEVLNKWQMETWT